MRDIATRALSDRRPIITYFLVIFATGTFALYSRWGALAFLWSLLATLLFGVGIPAPIFVYKYGKRKGYAQLPQKVATAFGASFVLTIAFSAWFMHSWLIGVLYGFLYFGYPGFLLFVAIQKFGLYKKVSKA